MGQVSAFVYMVLFNPWFPHCTPTSQPDKFMELCPGQTSQRLSEMPTKNDSRLRASRREHLRFKQTHSPPSAATTRGWQRGHYETDLEGMGFCCLVYRGRASWLGLQGRHNFIQKTIESSWVILFVFFFNFLVVPQGIVGTYFADQGSHPQPLHWRHILNHWTTREVPLFVLKGRGRGQAKRTAVGEEKLKSEKTLKSVLGFLC